MDASDFDYTVAPTRTPAGKTRSPRREAFAAIQLAIRTRMWYNSKGVIRAGFLSSSAARLVLFLNSSNHPSKEPALMCVSGNSQLPPISTPHRNQVHAAPLDLTSADGASFAAFLARPEAQPESPSAIGVVVLPDNRGLSGFYEALALRLAEHGLSALAIDYFGRTAGVSRNRGPEFPVMEHLMRLQRHQLFADIAAAIACLRSPQGGACQRVFTLGFCFGGRLALLTSAPQFGLAGAIGFYGFPGILFGAPGPTQLASGLSAPILGIFGGADTGIPPEAVSAFDQALTANAVPHEIVTYPGAPHSFFDIGYEEHAEACQDVWLRTIAFLQSPSQ